jgi:hypothetical protein
MTIDGQRNRLAILFVCMVCRHIYDYGRDRLTILRKS